VSTDRLCELLWEDNPPAQARAALRSQVTHVRAALARAGADRHGVEVVSHRGGYVLRVDPDLVDAHRFRTLLDQATSASDVDDRDRLLRDALALWQGPALDHDATDWPR
jgi:DNA-binding SARP family transcriptional activator